MLIGLSGMYAGAELPITQGSKVILGRDPHFCNLVFDQFSTGVSRCHCSITYNDEDEKYYVTDFSKNGTFTGDGKRLIPNVPIGLEKGTILYIGSRKDSFRLG